MSDDEDLKEGLKKSMSEPAKKRPPVTVRVFKVPRVPDDTVARDNEVWQREKDERDRQQALKDHRG